MKPSGRTLLVWGAIIILALTGADSPNSHPSPLQHLTDAAIACAEATQSENIQSAVLERHGWVPHADKLPAGVAQYWRPGVRFGIMVVDAPPQCTAVWSVKSSNGGDAIFSQADHEITQVLAQIYQGKFQSSDYRTEGNRKLHRFEAGNAVVIVTAEPLCPSCEATILKIGATNRHELPK